MAKKSAPPKRTEGSHGPTIKVRASPSEFNKATPKFCLKYLQRGYDVDNLDTQGRADFAMALQKRSSMTWGEILLSGRHGLGSELMPAKQIKPNKPEKFKEEENFLVIRYSGKLPMVGVRIADTFHIIWIEKKFGDVYDHGE